MPKPRLKSGLRLGPELRQKPELSIGLTQEMILSLIASLEEYCLLTSDPTKRGKLAAINKGNRLEYKSETERSIAFRLLLGVPKKHVTDIKTSTNDIATTTKLIELDVGAEKGLENAVKLDEDMPSLSKRIGGLAISNLEFISAAAVYTVVKSIGYDIMADGLAGIILVRYLGKKLTKHWEKLWENYLEPAMIGLFNYDSMVRISRNEETIEDVLAERDQGLYKGIKRFIKSTERSQYKEELYKLYKRAGRWWRGSTVATLYKGATNKPIPNRTLVKILGKKFANPEETRDRLKLLDENVAENFGDCEWISWRMLLEPKRCATGDNECLLHYGWLDLKYLMEQLGEKPIKLPFIMSRINRLDSVSIGLTYAGIVEIDSEKIGKVRQTKPAVFLLTRRANIKKRLNFLPIPVDTGGIVVKQYGEEDEWYPQSVVLYNPAQISTKLLNNIFLERIPVNSFDLISSDYSIPRKAKRRLKKLGGIEVRLGNELLRMQELIEPGDELKEKALARLLYRGLKPEEIAQAEKAFPGIRERIELNPQVDQYRTYGKISGIQAEAMQSYLSDVLYNNKKKPELERVREYIKDFERERQFE